MKDVGIIRMVTEDGKILMADKQVADAIGLYRTVKRSGFVLPEFNGKKGPFRIARVGVYTAPAREAKFNHAQADIRAKQDREREAAAKREADRAATAKREAKPDADTR